MKKENTRIFPAGHRGIDLDYQCEDQVGDDETHIFPTPSYTGVSEGNSASSFDVSCSIRMSRCLVVIWALVTPICCCEAIARVSISCRIWCSLLLAFLVQVGRSGTLSYFEGSIFSPSAGPRWGWTFWGMWGLYAKLWLSKEGEG